MTRSTIELLTVVLLQGPTLEFFTLVSREFQRRDLGMWLVERVRKEAVKHVGAGNSASTPSGAATSTPITISRSSREGRVSSNSNVSVDNSIDGEASMSTAGEDEQLEEIEYVANTGGLFPVPVR